MTSNASLVAFAVQVTQNCYAPYSSFRVGAALLGASGKVYLGVNIENAAYSPTICAERSAIARAVSDGEREFTRIAIVTKGAVTPCGVCRQTLREFAPDLEIVLADLQGNIRVVTTLKELLPDSFGPEHL
ncbi:MAG TPA: cytidine deaminase [Anaerolineales bacterium]|nr:cytidine deaminase [Anaerolineales bacterium]